MELLTYLEFLTTIAMAGDIECENEPDQQLVSITASLVRFTELRLRQKGSAQEYGTARYQEMLLHALQLSDAPELAKLALRDLGAAFHSLEQSAIRFDVALEKMQRAIPTLVEVGGDDEEAGDESLAAARAAAAGIARGPCRKCSKRRVLNADGLCSACA